MSFRGLLNKTATIERPSTTVSASGASSTTWSENATGVRCALQPRSGSSTQDALAQTLQADAVMYCEASVDVEPDLGGGLSDRVKVDGLYYTVLFVADMAGRGKYKKVYLKRYG